MCLYEVARERAEASPVRRSEKPGREAETPSRSVELERITATLLDALRASGYLDSKPSATAEEKIRRMVRRLKLSAEDSELLLGMLRKIMWKMGRK